MTRMWAFANQKGGVAKTTSVHSVAVALAERGFSVLAVDLDPQACLTFSFGLDPEGLDRTIHDVFLGRCESSDVIQTVGDVDLLPANIDLAGTEVFLLSRTGREYGLRKALSDVGHRYDIVLIDCPPSLGILTINGLTAAQEVVIPLQCETLSHRGVGQLLETVEDVRSYTNPDLRVRGVIATMFDGRTNLTKAVVADVPIRYGLEVLDPPIPKSVKVAEAPQHGSSVLQHAPQSKVAEAYRSLARSLVSPADDPPNRADASTTSGSSTDSSSTNDDVPEVVAISGSVSESVSSTSHTITDASGNVVGTYLRGPEVAAGSVRVTPTSE